MQGLTEAPRDTLTEAQVTELIRDAEVLTVDCGIELLDQSLNVLTDFSEYLKAGTVERGSFNTLHGSCNMVVTKTDLDWGTAIGRPYMILSGRDITARFNLGAYYLTSPDKPIYATPARTEVVGYDILDGLNDPVGATYSIAQGAAYLTKITEILTQRGYTKYIMDQTAAATVTPTARVWALDENTTWLTIINDMLASIGYQGVWSDWNGYLRMHTYISPQNRGPEWTYTSDEFKGQIYPERSIQEDYFHAPNRWVAIRQNNTEGDTPEEGDGIFTFTNQATGKTSVAARGRVITRILSIDAADQASLQAAAQISIDADMRIPIKAEVKTSANPLHWHFDRITVVDPDMGGILQAQATNWKMDLRTGKMDHSWTVLAL